MNLKEASRTLGVHYQTAYKWVRSGSLTAIRIGARYEVSQAAIDQFLASRRSVLLEAQPSPPARRATDLDLEDVIEEFEAMAADPVMSARSITNFAARRGAKALGDLCLVVVADDDGTHVRQAVVDHPVPAHAAFVSALLGATDKNLGLGPNIVADVFTTGRPVLIPHVSQDLLRAGTRPDMRQYIADYPIYSLLAAPIVASGRPAGFIAFSRDTADHPYTLIDQEFAVCLGERIGALLVTACEIIRAWQIRNQMVEVLHERLAHLGAGHPPTAADLDQWLSGHPAASDALVAVILDQEGRVLFMNSAARQIRGDMLSAVDRTIDVIPDDDRPQAQANFARLISGELDYLDSQGRQLAWNGQSFDWAMHQAAVRHPDATLACVVSVARPIRTSPKRLTACEFA